jgi:methionyl-tRNA formyltransferase
VRIVLLTTVPPVAHAFVPALRELGHEPVAIVSARYRPDRLTANRRAHLHEMVESAPAELDVLFPASKQPLERLFRAYEPDLVVCTGYSWKVTAEALAVPKLGAINSHPSLLPRHRGPIPFAWTLREGDSEWGITWHRMDAELDTGPILAQTSIPVLDDECTIDEIGPRIGAAALSLLPRALERVEAGDPGEPQTEQGATWAGYFGEDYATVDWSRPARAVHDQVRAWALTLGMSDVAGPFAELDDTRVRLLRTSLTERGDAVARVECADGPLWIVAYEPAA